MGPVYRLLEQDHRRLDRLLQKAMAGPELDTDAFEQFRAGLLRHIGMEEKVLFPAARNARGGEPVAGANRLRVDHSRLAAMLVPTPSMAIAEDIRDLLQDHNRLEEGPDGVYARCEAAIGDEAEAVAARLRDYPEVPLAPHFDGPGTYRPRRR